MVFAPITAGLVAGFIAFPRVARSRTGARVLGLAYRFLAAAIVLNLAVCAFLPAGPLQLAPLFVFSVGMALALPILIDRALAAVPSALGGVAASCQTFLQFAAMAAGAGLLAPLLWHSLFALALGTGLMTAAGGACLWHESRRRAGTTCPAPGG
jgi:DHA1 family bicyclomycin/chloramphenicol resistance-like MFS transporter